jgi:hypothetical protein
MKRSKKPKLPTEHQTRILRRIAATGCMMLTHEAGKTDCYTDAAGVTIAEPTARIFIKNGWVIAQRDSMFDLSPQSWKVRTTQ